MYIQVSLKVHWHEMALVNDFKSFALGRLVLFKNGARVKKFINSAIIVEDRNLERILSIHMMASCVYLVYYTEEAIMHILSKRFRNLGVL